MIALLQADGRRPNVEMALDLKLAEATVRARLQKLLSGGLLRITGIVDPPGVGLLTAAVIGVQVDVGRVDSAARQLAAQAEVQSVSITTGTWDILVEAVFPSDAELLAFLKERLPLIPGVRRTETTHILSRIKHVGNWTLPLTLARPRNGAVEPAMLRRVEFFSHLTDDVLALLADASRLKSLQAGARIYCENDEARELCIVDQGRVALLVDIGNGHQTVMETAVPQDVLGWASLLPPYIHMDTARCLEPATVIALPAAVVRDLCQSDCGACCIIMDRVIGVITSSLADARFKLIHALRPGE